MVVNFYSNSSIRAQFWKFETLGSCSALNTNIRPSSESLRWQPYLISGLADSSVSGELSAYKIGSWTRTWSLFYAAFMQRRRAVRLYPMEDRESKTFLYAAGRTHFLLLDLKLSSKFWKRTRASEFNGRHWAFLTLCRQVGLDPVH